MNNCVIYRRQVLYMKNITEILQGEVFTAGNEEVLFYSSTSESRRRDKDIFCLVSTCCFEDVLQETVSRLICSKIAKKPFREIQSNPMDRDFRAVQFQCDMIAKEMKCGVCVMDLVQAFLLRFRVKLG